MCDACPPFILRKSSCVDTADPELEGSQIRHGSMALGGLHEMMSDFMPATADAILAASLLMLWQAVDWHSWSSLRAVVQSVSTSVTCSSERTLI
jgi:hypothetical protein